MPFLSLPPGLLARLSGLERRLKGWRLAAFYGAGVMLVLGGVVIVPLLVFGLAALDAALVGSALAAAGLTALGGAAGGIGVYLVSTLVPPGRTGGPLPLAAGFAAYLAAILGALELAGGILGDELAPGGIREPGTWIGIAAVSLILAVGVWWPNR